ncbi:MAG: dehydrogenase [Magnetovibrio sp.]|nr:dehydrogenase [Magnetovibrio sp.]
MRLEGKVATVTGAGRGIGRACAIQFASEGAKVLVSDINKEEVEETAQIINELGGSSEFCICDTGNQKDCRNMVENAVASFGRLDIHLNNAAVLIVKKFLDFQIEDWNQVLRVNLTGFFLAGQAAARKMVELGNGGSIINMSSINAVLAIPDILPYVVSKGGVNQLTKVMALSLINDRIRVNGIGPGSIATDMVKQVMGTNSLREKILSRTPIGRLGHPDEVASLAVFLASEESSYITGETIYMDGGRMALNYTVPVET